MYYDMKQFVLFLTLNNICVTNGFTSLPSTPATASSATTTTPFTTNTINQLKQKQQPYTSSPSSTELSVSLFSPDVLVPFALLYGGWLLFTDVAANSKQKALVKKLTNPRRLSRAKATLIPALSSVTSATVEPEVSSVPKEAEKTPTAKPKLELQDEVDESKDIVDEIDESSPLNNTETDAFSYNSNMNTLFLDKLFTQNVTAATTTLPVAEEVVSVIEKAEVKDEILPREEVEIAMKEVIASISRAKDEEIVEEETVEVKETETTTIDVSVPYDAAAQLAYDEWREKYDKFYDTKKYETFKQNYEAVAVANVIAKSHSDGNHAHPNMELGKSADTKIVKLKTASKKKGSKFFSILFSSASKTKARVHAKQEEVKPSSEPKEGLVAKIETKTKEAPITNKKPEKIEGTVQQKEPEKAFDISIPYDAAAKLAYSDWRVKYDKGDFDVEKFETFKQNYETMVIANVIGAKIRREGKGAPHSSELDKFADSKISEQSSITDAIVSPRKEKAESVAILEKDVAVQIEPEVKEVKVEKDLEKKTIDVSIPYDAAARLAYDNRREKYDEGDFDAQKYETYKQTYEAIAIAKVKAARDRREGKDATKISEPSFNIDVKARTQEKVESVPAPEKPVAAMMESKKEKAAEIENEKKEITVKVESKKKEVVAKVESKMKEVTTKIESKKKEVTTKVESKNKEVIAKVEPKKKEVTTKVELKKEVTVKAEPVKKEVVAKVEQDEKVVAQKTPEKIDVDVSIPYDAAAKLAYGAWLEKYRKGKFNAQKYETFKKTYEAITVANVIAAKDRREGKDVHPSMELDEFADAEKVETPAGKAAVTKQVPEEAASNVVKTDNKISFLERGKKRRMMKSFLISALSAKKTEANDDNYPMVKDAKEKTEVQQKRPSLKKVEEDQVSLKKTEEKQVALKKTEEKQVALKKTEENQVALQKTEENQVALKKTEEKQVALKKTEEKQVALKKTEEKHVALKKTEEQQVALKKTEEKQVASKKKEEKQVTLNEVKQPPSKEIEESPSIAKNLPKAQSPSSESTHKIEAEGDTSLKKNNDIQTFSQTSSLNNSATTTFSRLLGMRSKINNKSKQIPIPAETVSKVEVLPTELKSTETKSVEKNKKPIKPKEVYVPPKINWKRETPFVQVYTKNNPLPSTTPAKAKSTTTPKYDTSTISDATSPAFGTSTIPKVKPTTAPKLDSSTVSKDKGEKAKKMDTKQIETKERESKAVVITSPLVTRKRDKIKNIIKRLARRSKRVTTTLSVMIYLLLTSSRSPTSSSSTNNVVDNGKQFVASTSESIKDFSPVLYKNVDARTTNAFTTVTEKQIELSVLAKKRIMSMQQQEKERRSVYVATTTTTNNRKEELENLLKVEDSNDNDDEIFIPFSTHITKSSA